MSTKALHNNSTLVGKQPMPIVVGGGARKLLESYLNDVLQTPHTKNAIAKRSRKIESTVAETPYLTMETTAEVFASTPFEEQLVHPLTKSIPLLSESAISNRHLNPLHDTKHKKMILEVCSRIKRDDTEMRRCRLNSERIDDFVCQQISSSLYKNTNLQQLELHDNNITDDGAHYLSKAISKHPNLLSLWLGNNRLTDVAAMHIATMISKNSKIKEVNLSNKWPPFTKGTIELESHPRITHIGAQYIADVLKNTKDVNMIGDAVATASQPAPRSSIVRKGNHNTLTNLCLAEQRIGDIGAIELFNSLQYCHLRQLNLTGNELTDECCPSLRQALENPATVLQSLNISCNAITDVGLQEIVSALSVNQSLLSLNVSVNRITDDGLDALYNCLIKSNEVLTRVQTTNNIGTDGRAEIYASRRLLAPSAPISKKNSENNLHNLLHTKSMNSKKKTFTFSSSSGKLPQLADDNMVVDSSPPMDVVDADSDESEEEDEEEEVQGVSEHTASTSTSVGQSDNHQISPSKENSLGEKSRTVTFSSGSLEGTEDKTHPMSSTSPHGISNKGFLTNPKTSKNSAKDFDWMNSNVPAARSNSGGGDGAANASIRIDNRGNKFLTYEKKLVNFFTPPSAMLPPHLRPLTDGADKQRGLPLYQREGGKLVTSADQLGKTIGVPYLSNLSGINPLRSNVSEHSDSAQHFAYIKVFASPRKGSASFTSRQSGGGFEDEDGSSEVITARKPYSLLEIARDRQQEIDRIKKERQSQEYKNAKVEATRVDRILKSKQIDRMADLKPPPKEFWDLNKQTVRLKYAGGVDKTSGCVSTTIRDNEKQSFTAGLTSKQRKDLYLKPLSEWTPAEVLAERRRRASLKVTAGEMAGKDS